MQDCSCFGPSFAAAVAAVAAAVADLRFVEVDLEAPVFFFEEIWPSSLETKNVQNQIMASPETTKKARI